MPPVTGNVPAGKNLSGAAGRLSSLDALLATLDMGPGQAEGVGVGVGRGRGRVMPVSDVSDTPQPAIAGSAEGIALSSAPAGGLGANARFAPALEAAATRTGIPAPALAAIIDAEAARLPDGTWNPHSRNPRSSAAGLGQFLSGTWLEMARREGTWLNAAARQRGLVDAQGHIAPHERGALLALRHDPAASIEAVADYARGNVEAMRRRGIAIGNDAQSLARAAYIGHHLGPGDAIRFYDGTIAPERARILLGAQIGADRAMRRIARSGNAPLAHRQWLMSHIDAHVRPGRYTALERVNL
jgi:hypothetical protein